MSDSPTYEELYEWAREHSWWQWDALRRVVAQGDLTEADIDELIALAKAGRPEPTRTVSTTFKIRGKKEPPPGVSLRSIHKIRRVNALGEGPITFQPDGLTIVYGKNASGKSGLTRILKKTCRAANPGDRILPSYHEDDTGEPASATITYQVNGSQEHFAWVAGGNESPALRNVHVFDLPSALSLVEQANRLEYTPEVILTLRQLLAVTERVEAKLEAEKGALGGRPEALRGLLGDSNTKAAQAFRALSRFTNSEAIDAFTAFSAEDASRLNQLDDALRDNPIGRARLAEERAAQVRRYAEVLDRATSLLSDVALAVLQKSREEAHDTARAASLARDVFASNSELPDVGAEGWKELWESARRYSESFAYPGRSFPVVQDALCVLCQQPVGPEARTRLAAFEAFVTSDTETRSASVEGALRIELENLKALRLPRSTVVAEFLGFERGSPEWRSLKQFIVLAKLRQRRVLQEVLVYPELPDPPGLSSHASALETQATTLREAARAEARTQMEAERAELADRNTLQPLACTIRAEVARLEEVARLDALIADCDTGRITRKARETARTIVEGRLGSAFSTNLAKFGFASTGISISLGAGERAVHPWKMGLMERPNIDPIRVLSEGERTCVALAGFLAELAASDNASAIVLDDPVTSLDHSYRDKVAERLVEEAKCRQVIVFTHEIVFLYELRKHAARAGMAPKEISIERGHRRHGAMKDGPPWAAMPVGRRIGQLRNDLVEAERFLKEERRDEYELRCERLYKRLRQSWEHAVEEVLLSQVVQRFGTDVQTRKLRYLTDITDADVAKVDQEMARCSDFVHDEAGPRTVDIPEPSVIRDDIARLENWVRDVRNRRK